MVRISKKKKIQFEFSYQHFPVFVFFAMVLYSMVDIIWLRFDKYLIRLFLSCCSTIYFFKVRKVKVVFFGSSHCTGCGGSLHLLLYHFRDTLIILSAGQLLFHQFINSIFLYTHHIECDTSHFIIATCINDHKQSQYMVILTNWEEYIMRKKVCQSGFSCCSMKLIG